MFEGKKTNRGVKIVHIHGSLVLPSQLINTHDYYRVI